MSVNSNSNNINNNLNLFPDLGGANPAIINQFSNDYTPLQPRIPQESNTGTIWDTMTPEQRMTVFQERQQSALQGDTGSFLGNIGRNAKEIGTGLASLWHRAGDKDSWKQAWKYLSQTSSPQIMSDYLDLQFSPYKFKVSDIEQGRPIGDIVLGALQGAHENPIDAFLDFVSLGGGKLLLKGGNLVNKVVGDKLNTRVLPSETGVKIEQALAGEAQSVKTDMAGLFDSAKSIKSSNLPELIRAAEEGTPVPKGLESDFNRLKSFSDKYDELAQKYSPYTHVNADELATYQRYARKNNISYEQATKELTPLMEEWKLGNLDLEDLAKKGKDSKASFILESNKLYNEGKIFPVTHGLAEVDKLASEVTGEGRKFAGRFTTRAFGNSAYEDIAKQIQKPDEFIQKITEQYIDKHIADKIIEGKLSDFDLAAKDAGNNVKYLSRQDLSEGNLKKALEGARGEKLLEDDIPVNNVALQELKHQMAGETGAFAGISNDLYKIGKSSLLASGGYIGANAITGATQALLNSNVGLLNDVIDAIKSKGELAKKLGVYRYNTADISKNKVVAFIQNSNNISGGNILRKADALLQNAFAEIAAHSELRKQGLKVGDIDRLQQSNKMKLGEMITDIKKVALINSPNTILNKNVTSALSAYNPFWRWTDTATQATMKLLEKSPTLANTVLVDVLASIAFDKEMQERLRLNVSPDTPFTTYKFDDKTGEIRQMTAEFVPITTTLKLIAPDSNTSFSPSVPFFTAMVNAMQGKDKYGNPNKRAINTHSKNIATVMGKRYEYTPEGGYREVKGMGDEILATAVKELFGGVNLINKTVAPLFGTAVGKLTGQDIHYNQPYAQSIFGDFNDWDDKNNIIMGGSMDRQRTGEQVIRGLSGLYEQRYNPMYEDRPPMSRNAMKDFWKKISRQENRRPY